MPERLPQAIAQAREVLGLAGPGAALVGGAVRDLLLGQTVRDWDIVTTADPRATARVIASAVGGSVFPLSVRHGAWRVAGAAVVYDVTPRLGASLEEDLLRRDFTIGAIAIDGDGTVHDPANGIEDLQAGILRVVSDRAFADDPLRLVRLARFLSELRFTVEPFTRALADRDGRLVAETAPERVLTELLLLLRGEDAEDALRLLMETGVAGALLPELASLAGVEQGPFHQFDVLGHTLKVVDATADIARFPTHYLPGAVAEALVAALGHPIDGASSGRDVLMLAALLHDIAKPATRAERSDGTIGFPGHAAAGAPIARGIVRRLRGSVALASAVENLVEHHLLIGFMVREPLTPRAIHRFRVATRPYEMLALALSLGDRVTLGGPRAHARGVRRHRDFVARLALAHLEQGPTPAPLVRGNELIEQFAVAPGPLVGRIVARLVEEQAAGAVGSRAEAESFVRAAIAAQAT